MCYVELITATSLITSHSIKHLINQFIKGDVQVRFKRVLYFRLKFYVTDPSRLQEEYTRYHAYLQVKHDLTVGRLVAPVSTVCLLTSYAVQSSLGDWDPDTSRPPYLGKTTNTSSYSD